VRKIIIAFLLLCVSGSVFSKDYGTIGQLFPIQEPDLLTFIKSRLNQMQKDGELNGIRKKAIENVEKHAVRPEAVPGLSPATADKSWLYDPTFIVNQDIQDMSGNYIARKGDKVNPLDKIPFNETLFFIDGDNISQVKWLEAQLKNIINFKVILVNGNVRTVSDQINERVYFDQAGVLTTKFGFQHTPVMVSKEGDKLRVTEKHI